MSVGKGISVEQRAVLQLLHEKGRLGLFDVLRFLIDLRLPLEGSQEEVRLMRAVRDLTWYKDAIPMRFDGRYARDFSGVSNVYRMMRSLEKRGLAAELMHARPKEYYAVYWWRGRPFVVWTNSISLKMSFMVAEGKRILIRTKGKTWEVPVPTDGHRS